jgi:hypothetical protein
MLCLSRMSHGVLQKRAVLAGSLESGMPAPERQLAKVMKILMPNAAGVTVERIGKIQGGIAGDQTMGLSFTKLAGHCQYPPSNCSMTPK